PPGAVPVPLLPPVPATPSGPVLNFHQQNTAQSVVLTRLPPFLRGVRPLRDASYPCGSARTVHLGCCVPSSADERRKMKVSLRGRRAEFLNGVFASKKVLSSRRRQRSGKENLAFRPWPRLAMFLWLRSLRPGRGTSVQMVEASFAPRLGSNAKVVGCAVCERGMVVGSSSTEKEAGEHLGWWGAGGGCAVVKMGHFIGARNFAGGMLALAKLGREGGPLPEKPGAPAPENPPAAAAENGGDAPKTEGTNGTAAADDKDSATKAPQYTKEEESDRRATLAQLKDLRVYHAHNFQIPDPIPPDLDVPMPPPSPQDPYVPHNLLEALTALRLRYEELVKESANAKPGDQLSTSVSYLDGDQWGGHAAAADGSDETTFKVDVAKAAAAAGGGAYDEEADPLNAPDVVRAVLAFKRRLEDQNVRGKRRRVDVVTEKVGRMVAEFLERGRREKEEERERKERLEKGEAEEGKEKTEEEAKVYASGGAAASAKDTGRRGVSNLPAWMTKGEGGAAAAATAPTTAEAATIEPGQKRKFVPSEANRDLNARKTRLEVDGMTPSQIRAANEAADRAAATAASFVARTEKASILAADSKFPVLSSEDVSALKAYVAAKIVEYLGEEESTLIDFILTELGKEGGGSVAALLEEMRVVLDEDAEEFVLGLYRKTVEGR
ncbi:hypothetical protein ACHAWF_004743, partial [Thalassiosira exigua]